MAETLLITAAPDDKAGRYRELIPQIVALWGRDRDSIACMANTAAALYEVFQFHWVGFYRVVDQALWLGPFQGPVACSRIDLGKGVCGTAWKENRTIRVDDVDAFPGHIACSTLSKSEIVVPVRNTQGHVVAVLDIDSSDYSAFDTIDQQALELLCSYLSKQWE